MRFIIEVGQGLASDLQGDSLRLSGVERDLGEGLELFLGTVQARLDIAHIELYDLFTGSLACIGDVQRDLEAGVGAYRPGACLQWTIGEAGVREAIAKWEEGCDLLFIVIAIANEEPLAIMYFPVLAGIVDIGRVVLQ